VNIGFDLDGVLYRWHEALYRELTLFYGLNEDYHTFWKEDYHKIYDSKCWYNFVRWEHLVSCQFPNPEHVKFLNELAINHNIFYLTHRPDEVHFSTVQWLTKNHFPQIENLIFPPLESDKSFEIRQLEIDVYCDDRENIVRTASKLCDAYLVEQPWNEDKREGLKCIPNILSLKPFLKL
jgi:uncharacterized HAD superfamily protein